uniref:RxLR effector protein n=1 Tax=Phytophthora agathidicida TaxID=1642459 RepID=A0A7G4WI25_9STRA|nr:PaRXLR36 [Phytophthora agathidicida]
MRAYTTLLLLVLFAAGEAVSAVAPGLAKLAQLSPESNVRTEENTSRFLRKRVDETKDFDSEERAGLSNLVDKTKAWVNKRRDLNLFKRSNSNLFADHVHPDELTNAATRLEMADLSKAEIALYKLKGKDYNKHYWNQVLTGSLNEI